MKLNYLILALIFFLLLEGCVSNEKQTSRKELPSNFLLYSNTVEGFSIGYPNYWKAKENFEGVTVAFTKEKHFEDLNADATVTILIKKLSNPFRTLDNFVEINLDSLEKEFPSLKVLSKENITLADGTKVKQIILFDSENGMPLIKTLQVYTLKNGKGFVLNYLADENTYDLYIKDVNAMIESIEIS